MGRPPCSFQTLALLRSAIMLTSGSTIQAHCPLAKDLCFWVYLVARLRVAAAGPDCMAVVMIAAETQECFSAQCTRLSTQASKAGSSGSEWVAFQDGSSAKSHHILH
ncbi:hypothetical protein BJ546DRAFT_677334 [Cryomyces antarcticus]